MSDTLRELIAKWRAEGARVDTFHATMGIGYKVCANELEEAVSALAPLVEPTFASWLTEQVEHARRVMDADAARRDSSPLCAHSRARYDALAEVLDYFRSVPAVSALAALPGPTQPEGSFGYCAICYHPLDTCSHCDSPAALPDTEATAPAKTERKPCDGLHTWTRPLRSHVKEGEPCDCGGTEWNEREAQPSLDRPIEKAIDVVRGLRDWTKRMQLPNAQCYVVEQSIDFLYGYREAMSDAEDELALALEQLRDDAETEVSSG